MDQSPTPRFPRTLAALHALRHPKPKAGALVALALVAGTAVGPNLGSASASANPHKPPKPPKPALVATGAGTWSVREALGDAVVNGHGTLSEPRHHRGRPDRVLIAAVVGPDDRTLPAPGQCETATTTVTVYGRRGVDFTMIGSGDVCGLDVQPPTSIVTHAFTGTFEVYGDGTRPRRLLGTDGFFEVRLAQDGTAHVFAIDT
jgi:hypothetical protein